MMVLLTANPLLMQLVDALREGRRTKSGIPKFVNETIPSATINCQSNIPDIVGHAAALLDVSIWFIWDQDFSSKI